MSLFETLWDNHPTITEDDFPCSTESGAKNFENQCAIRMGVCLERSGFDLSKFPVAHCWHHEKSLRHILRAEELANALKNFSLSEKIRKPIVFEGSEGFSKISGKKGIIFFKDYYGTNNSGDHIDLWNGSRLTKLDTYFQFLMLGGWRYKKATVWFFQVMGDE